MMQRIKVCLNAAITKENNLKDQMPVSSYTGRLLLFLSLINYLQMKRLFMLLVILTGTVASFAQQKDTAMQSIPDSVMKVVYTCGMHPEVMLDKSGKCPKCGMELVAQEIKVAAKKTYTCPMHPEITSDKPGKCSKCGTSLTLSKKEEMKMKAMGIYTCPMHPDETSDKPGKCSKCGMDLVEKKSTEKPNK